MKNLSGITSVFLFALLLTGCVDRRVVNIDSRGKTIVCFGDSITYGYGAGGRGKDYPAVLSQMLSVPVLNMGMNDDTTEEALKRIQQDVLDKEPLLVVLELGGNDFLKKDRLQDTVANIERMVRMIQKKGAMVALADISNELIMPEYGAALRKLSKELGAIFIPDLLSGIIAEPSLKSDPIHPNAKGYRMVAQRVYRTIIPYLNQNTMLRGTRVRK